MIAADLAEKQAKGRSLVSEDFHRAGWTGKSSNRAMAGDGFQSETAWVILCETRNRIRRSSTLVENSINCFSTTVERLERARQLLQECDEFIARISSFGYARAAALPQEPPQA